MLLPSGPAEYGYQNFIGIPYKWGGKNPESGFDCSGAVSECLKAFGLLPTNALLNSQDLYDLLKDFGVSSAIERDSILFFGRSTGEICHVALALDGRYMIEAAGEGRINTDKGSVRMRPIAYRSDLIAVVKLDFH